jgi:hypothetical protein
MAFIVMQWNLGNPNIHPLPLPPFHAHKKEKNTGISKNYKFTLIILLL